MSLNLMLDFLIRFRRLRMHAIVEIAGKQFRVTNNDKIKVPLLSYKEGDKINFDRILYYEDDKGNVTFGKPVVDKMSIGATVLEHGRDKKIIVFKKKRRKGYQKKNGHRQGYSLIEINEIGAAKASPKKAETKTTKATETKELKETAAKTTTKKTTTKAAKKPAEKKVTKKADTEKKTKTATTKTTAKKAAAKAKPKATTKKAEPKAKTEEK